MKHKTTESARVIEVIETTSLRGSDNDSDPVRTVAQYWEPTTGELLAENDPGPVGTPSIHVGLRVREVPIEVRGARIERKIQGERIRWALTIGDLSKPYLQTKILMPCVALDMLMRDLERLGLVSRTQESSV